MGKLISRTSDRGTYRQCRTLWNWSSPLRGNLEPEQRYPPFEDGTSWHGALEVYYDPVTWHLLQDPLTAEAVRHSARMRLLSIHNSQVALATLWSGGSLAVENEEDYAERLIMLQGMLEHYFVWAPENDLFTPKLIEIEFEVPVETPEGLKHPAPDLNDEVVYQGRLDGLVEDPTGRYWILEHKTTGQMGRTDWLDVDAQVGSYAWAIQKQLGIQIAGIIYSQALKAAPSPPTMLVQQNKGRNFSVNKQQRTTYQLYLAELEKHGESLEYYGEFLRFLSEKENPFFRRIQVHRNQASLEFVGRNIYLEATEMFDPNLNIYPNPSYFNCNGCRFREPCIAQQNGYDYQFILDELFVDRKEAQKQLEAITDTITQPVSKQA